MRYWKTLTAIATIFFAINFALQAEEIRLWEGNAPGAQGTEGKDIVRIQT